ncbi:DUF4124 domain-containing protein [Hahella sp. HN01]|uniref:DUF4124 domain-containing protein n=1 Tax=Hahella sp. HN01 TaxID=2847262 RepID=UPI0020A6CA4F|nr:DUF4124 domain-containing protein [Hahella sp. HN01]
MARRVMADNESGLRWKRTARMGALCFAVLYSGLGYGQIYKCVNAKGKVAFQETPCPGASAQTEVEIRAAPTPAAVEEAHQINRRMEPDIEYVNPEQSSPMEEQAVQEYKAEMQKKCDNLKEKMLEEEKKIVAECNKRRDVYCDLPPEKIIETYEDKQLSKLNNQQQYLYLQNKKPHPLFAMKKFATLWACDR